MGWSFLLQDGLQFARAHCTAWWCKISEPGLNKLPLHCRHAGSLDRSIASPERGDPSCDRPLQENCSGRGVGCRELSANSLVPARSLPADCRNNRVRSSRYQTLRECSTTRSAHTPRLCPDCLGCRDC